MPKKDMTNLSIAIAIIAAFLYALLVFIFSRTFTILILIDQICFIIVGGIITIYSILGKKKKYSLLIIGIAVLATGIATFTVSFLDYIVAILGL